MSEARATAPVLPAPVRWPALLRWLGAALSILGFGIAGFGLWFVPAPVIELPFTEMTAPVEPTEVGADGLSELVPGGRLQRLELVARATGVVVANGTLLHRGARPVLLGWRSALAEPILYPDIDSTEEIRLAAALRRHLPPGAPVLALPERSRRLVLLAGVDAPLAAADDSAGLRVPEPWLSAQQVVRDHERARTGQPAGAAATAAFQSWLEALLAPAEEGAARLQVLSEGRTAFLVLHVMDAFTLGLLRPTELAVGLHDLPGGAALHDSVRLVKGWVRAEGHAGYAVLPRGQEALRVVFLAGETDTRRLVANLLPFDTADLGALSALRLVFQHAGYWVWRIEPVVDAAEAR